jgi:ABC-type antimicrobial peptide transport system, ATPase component
MNQVDHIIHASGLVKIYKVAELEVVALQGLDLEVARGELLALVGPSGSGKSTLLSLIGGLDRPSAGQLVVDGLDLTTLTPTGLSAYRRDRVGFIWQQTTRNLLPYLSARENIELLMTFAGRGGRERRAWTDELLEAVGIADKASTPVTQLSGGQQQRVALACALANRPRILLGDEPTGEVDWETAQRVLTLLRDLRTRYGLTIVLVTHDPRVAEQRIGSSPSATGAPAPRCAAITGARRVVTQRQYPVVLRARAPPKNSSSLIAPVVCKSPAISAHLPGSGGARASNSSMAECSFVRWRTTASPFQPRSHRGIITTTCTRTRVRLTSPHLRHPNHSLPSQGSRAYLAQAHAPSTPCAASILPLNGAHLLRSWVRAAAAKQRC